MNQVQQCSLPNRADLVYDGPSPTYSPPSLPSRNHLLVPQLYQNNSDSKSPSYNNFSSNQPYHFMQTFSTFTSPIWIFTYSVQMQEPNQITIICKAKPKKTNFAPHSESLPNKLCSLYQQSHNGMIHVIANEEMMELLCGSEARSTRIPHHHSS